MQQQHKENIIKRIILTRLKLKYVFIKTSLLFELQKYFIKVIHPGHDFKLISTLI
jgi:hypothetical protein